MNNKEKFIKMLADVLVEHHVMTRDRALDLQKAFGESSIEEFEDFLLEEGLVDPEDLLAALSKYYNVPFYDVKPTFFRTHLLREFPKDFLLRNAIIPLEVENHTSMSMVAAQPLRDGLESAIRGFVSYDIIFYVGLRRDICDAVKEYYDKALTEGPVDEDLREERIDEREARQAEINSDTDDEQID
jgi:hypothetical protein